MSRRNPIGFLFSMVLEIAAVALLVSLMPRVDLRPQPASATGALATVEGLFAAARQQPAVAPAGWTDDRSSGEPRAGHAEYDERQATDANDSFVSARSPVKREPPPLIEATPERAQYVEDRLDRASQQLLNSVGSFATRAASEFVAIAPQPRAAPPRAETYSNQITDGRMSQVDSRTPPSTAEAFTSHYAPPPGPASARPQGSFPTEPSASILQRPAATTFQPRKWMHY